jgi:hypothetical protein
MLRNAVATLVAGIMIATAILIAFRYEISAATGVVYRLDRWSGQITACELSGGPCTALGQ